MSLTATRLEKEPKWVNWGPTTSGDIYSCFGEKGLLYRIVDPETLTWSFYNDSYAFEMQATLMFSTSAWADVELLPGVASTERMYDGDYKILVVIQPMETIEFLRARVPRVAFRCEFKAVPISQAYLKRVADRAKMSASAAIAAVQRVSRSSFESDVLDACIQNNIAYVDPAFPPVQASLDKDRGTLPFGAWLRPEEFLPAHLRPRVGLFTQPIAPNNVLMGELGDSWVVGALAALTEYPDFLQGVFCQLSDDARSQAEERCGATRLLLVVHGRWRCYILDSFLPVQCNQQRFARSAGDPCEMWVSLLEKALAKRYGCYANIAAGDPLIALRDLTGFPTVRLDSMVAAALKSQTASADLFQRLQLEVAAGNLVLVSTPSKARAAVRWEEMGLACGFSYTVLGAWEVDGQRLLQLRHPWSDAPEDKWQGRWRDSSPVWDQHTSVAAAVQPARGKPGAIFVDWKELLQFFDGCGVCYTHFDCIDYRIPIDVTAGVSNVVLEVSAKEDTTLTIVLSQSDAAVRPVLLSIAAATPGANPRTMSLVACSTDDAAEVAERLTYVKGRDVAVMYRFQAAESPYWVVPRVARADDGPGTAPNCSAVLGVLSETLLDPRSPTQVRLLRVDPRNAVWQNATVFPATADETAAVVQIKSGAALQETSGVTVLNHM